MKVLQVINGLNIGGAETLLTNYLLYTKNKNEIQNDLCVLYDNRTFLYERLVDNGIKINNLKLNIKYDLSAIYKLIRLIKENKYDVVHVHLFPAQYFCAIASIFTPNVKYIFTEHSTFNRRRKYLIFRFLDYLSYLPYKKIICISEMVKNDLLKWIPSISGKIIVIYNGIPIENKKERQKIYDILLVGSLRSNVKGVDILLKAIKIIKDDISKVAIAGDGILKNELIELRNSLGLENKVDFLGNRSDISNLLEQSKIFVLPSRWEGLSNSILEAMAKAKPIIASNVGGIPELIQDGITGILVKPEDEWALADAIMNLLNNEELANRLGENAYQKVTKEFSIQNYANKLIEFYNSIL